MNDSKISKERIESPEILILASRYDISCDYVISKLYRLGRNYFRLNREDFSSFSLSFDPERPRLHIESNDIYCSISPEDLKSIWYRRPVFVRETNIHNKSPQELLERAQWMDFTRAFMVFEQCKWMNHPTATYKAENKVVQLHAAARIGLKIPITRIANSTIHLPKELQGQSSLAVKGLDTVHIKSPNVEIFAYTTMSNYEELSKANISTAPLIIQQSLDPKLDLRVTIVNEDVFCASVTRSGESIHGDWRLEKQTAEFKEYELPQEISDKCIKLVKTLGLRFGAIDLALKNDEYYFLEINPTGEWSWLVDHAGLQIDESISKYLAC